MNDRKYRIVVASTRAGLPAAAGARYTVLESTIRPFTELGTNDDHTLGNIGAVRCAQPGFVALAYQDV